MKNKFLIIAIVVTILIVLTLIPNKEIFRLFDHINQPPLDDSGQIPYYPNSQCTFITNLENPNPSIEDYANNNIWISVPTSVINEFSPEYPLPNDSFVYLTYAYTTNNHECDWGAGEYLNILANGGFRIYQAIPSSNVYLHICGNGKTVTYRRYDGDITYPANLIFPQISCLPNSGQCIPRCYNKECGDNGCGGSCGTCSGICENFKCSTSLCIPNWKVGTWSNCVGGIMTRQVTDLNSCANNNNKPLTSTNCKINQNGSIIISENTNNNLDSEDSITEIESQKDIKKTDLSFFKEEVFEGFGFTWLHLIIGFAVLIIILVSIKKKK